MIDVELFVNEGFIYSCLLVIVFSEVFCFILGWNEFEFFEDVYNEFMIIDVDVIIL